MTRMKVVAVTYRHKLSDSHYYTMCNKQFFERLGNMTKRHIDKIFSNINGMSENNVVSTKVFGASTLKEAFTSMQELGLMKSPTTHYYVFAYDEKLEKYSFKTKIVKRIYS